MKRETNHGGVWRALFEEQHSELTKVAKILLCRQGSPEATVQTALAELDGSPFYKAFGLVSATRAVVKAAIAHNYISIDSWILTAPSGPVDYERSKPQPLEELPWAERAAHFLREVLDYSRQDTALLLRISDANVDRLNGFAKKRMGYAVHTLDHSDTLHLKPTRVTRSANSMAFASYE